MCGLLERTATARTACHRSHSGCILSPLWWLKDGHNVIREAIGDDKLPILVFRSRRILYKIEHSAVYNLTG